MSQTISFYLGDESRLVIDSFESKKESIFNASYNKVLKEISEYVKQNASQDSRKQDTFYSQTADVYVNNIFAFIGDRGTGKSSCMFSVANMLKDDELSKKSVECGVKFDLAQGFEILENIDPSFFDEKTNILSIVLGRLFSNFKNAVDNDKFTSKYGYEAEKDELFKKFQEVKKSLTCLLTDKKLCEEDTIDELMNLTASVDLRKNMKSLLELYLKFFKKDFLVIPVDDIDLHTQCAYKMVEELRKYLRQEKVIILMALKLEQLQQVIEREFLSKHKEMLDKKMMTESDIIDMASKYLIKLIPEKNRIYLPTVKVWADSILNVYQKNSIDEKQFVLIKNVDFDQTVKYFVTTQIFAKTRFLFYHTQGSVSPIVPRNLRELRFLIALIHSMPVVDRSKPEILEYNKSLFKEYFISTWAIANLSSEGLSIFKEIMNIEDPALFNKKVLQILKNKYEIIPSISSNLDEEEIEIKLILDEENSSYNISLGDVLLVLNVLEKKVTYKEDLSLLFAIKSFYSMKLCEYYDWRSEPHYKSELKDRDRNVDYSVKKMNVVDSLSPYEILVGGAFFNITNKKYIAALGESTEIKRRDLRPILSSSLNEYKKLIEEKIKDNEEKVRLLEFFSLFISRKNYDVGKAGISELRYRKQNEVVHDSALNANNLIFDVSSLFVNITNLERQYDRICEGFSEYIKNEEMWKTPSLFKQIEKYCKENRGIDRKDYDSMLSWASIRNVDVIESLDKALNYANKAQGQLIYGVTDPNSDVPKRNHKFKNEDVNHIYKYLIRLERFFIYTYDTIDEKSHYNINFKFIGVVLDFMETMDEEAFLAIYDSKKITLENKKVLNKETKLAVIVPDYEYKTSDIKEFFEQRYVAWLDSEFYKEFVDTNVKPRRKYRGEDVKRWIEFLDEKFIDPSRLPMSSEEFINKYM